MEQQPRAVGRTPPWGLHRAPTSNDICAAIWGSRCLWEDALGNSVQKARAPHRQSETHKRGIGPAQKTHRKGHRKNGLHRPHRFLELRERGGEAAAAAEGGEGANAEAQEEAHEEEHEEAPVVVEEVAKVEEAPLLGYREFPESATEPKVYIPFVTKGDAPPRRTEIERKRKYFLIISPRRSFFLERATRSLNMIGIRDQHDRLPQSRRSPSCSLMERRHRVSAWAGRKVTTRWVLRDTNRMRPCSY
jgi:hypothetical protein